MASDAVVPVLPEGAGYGVVVGIGFFFALVMAGVSWMQVRVQFPACGKLMLTSGRTNIRSTQRRQVRNSIRLVEV